MSKPICYYSTNRNASTVILRDALLQGQAADRGLFMPERFPTLTTDTLRSLKGADYPRTAREVLSLYTTDMMSDDQLDSLVQDAYDFDVPIEHVTGRLHVMRLDRGPTASFKDFAARMMGRWLGLIKKQDGGELVILTATSGDTGSAVAHAFHGVERIRVLVVFPIAEVSDRQRKQMTTIGGNVTTYGIEGKFDDCQALVKQAFADPQLKHIPLTSANSINIGRLLPQSVYYVYAYLCLADVDALKPITFCVPSGNFGDMMGAVIAAKMGIPIKRLIIATNDNDEVPNFLRTGRYEKIVPSRVCISNAMNVGHPSNLARLVDIYGGRMDETGSILQLPDMEAMRRDLYAVSIDDNKTRDTIKDAYRHYNLLLEPHGAVGWAGLEHYISKEANASDLLAVSVETAHPAKFPEEIRSLLGFDPETPPTLAGLDQKAEHYEMIETDYPSFRALLERQFA